MTGLDFQFRKMSPENCGGPAVSAFTALLREIAGIGNVDAEASIPRLEDQFVGFFAVAGRFLLAPPLKGNRISFIKGICFPEKDRN